MSDPGEVVARRYALARAEGRPLAWWGVIMLSITEAMLFGMLLFTYFYLWGVSSEWPPAGVSPPELRVSAVRTVLLLSTSGTVWLAERGLRRGDRRATTGWLWATVILAGVFLAGHAEETHKILSAFRWDDHAYGSIFYVITNVHAAHLTIGLLVFAFLMVRLARGAAGPDAEAQLATGGLYWHFVDAVWVFVYTSLYLLPNLLGG